MNSYKNNKICTSTHILVNIVNFFEDYNRYRVEFFNIN